jgi:uncharacterized membrane protein YkoI
MQTGRWKMPISFRSIAILLLASITLTGMPGLKAVADDDEVKNYDALQQAVKQGEIRSLSDILTATRDKLPAGEVIGAEIERKHGLWVYELKIVGNEGRVYEVKVDARTGDVGKIEEK